MKVTISVVSHSDAEELLGLLSDVANFSSPVVAEVIVTLNVEGDRGRVSLEAVPWPFPLRIIQNSRPKGFGANHNAAFQEATGDFFCVLNPDLRWQGDPLVPLLKILGENIGVGCVHPVQVNESGQRQDFRRSVPTPLGLLMRHFCNVVRQKTVKTDWINGAFMLFPCTVFRSLNGFDERYFMYCEDVELCLRLQLHGWRLEEGGVEVVHVGRRASRSSAQHLRWHLTSLFRLWLSKTFWQYLLSRCNR